MLSRLGEVKSVTPNIEGSGRHAFGTIGPDKTPVVALPGDPISAYISNELFIRPMIRNMMVYMTFIDQSRERLSLMMSLAIPVSMHSYARFSLRITQAAAW